MPDPDNSTSVNADTPLIFPAGFLWGTATAAYQIEGSVHAEGRGVSIWDTFSRLPGATHNGDNGDVSCDHYRRLDGDLDLLAELGAPAYRFSVAWPRVQPTGKGPPNPEGLDFYRRLVDGLCERGIMPVLTLYHWDLPQPLEDAGGWVARDTAGYFADYAGIVAEALGRDVGMWITLNEPWCSAWSGYGSGHHAPGGRDIGEAAAATHHLLLAHGVAVTAIRSAIPGAKVGITLNLTPIRAASEHSDDVSAARLLDGNMNRLFLDPLSGRGYPEDMLAHYEGRLPGFEVVLDDDLEVIGTPIDFLGVNFYSPRSVASVTRLVEANSAGYFVPSETDLVNEDLGVVLVRPPKALTTEMGWEIEPGALRDLLVRVRLDYGDFPVYITENGAACNDYVAPDGRVHDPDRIRYLRGHLHAVLDAIEAGVDVRGYFVWSLLDNFEWAHGFSRRFGLAWVDFPSGVRIPKSSFSWFREVVHGDRSADAP